MALLDHRQPQGRDFCARLDAEPILADQRADSGTRAAHEHRDGHPQSRGQIGHAQASLAPIAQVELHRGIVVGLRAPAKARGVLVGGERRQAHEPH